MSMYPEHDKLREIQPLSQAIGEFLEWCAADGREMVLAEWVNDGGWMLPASKPTEKLLAQFFQIDLDKIETEKRQIRQMLDLMKKLNDEVTK